MNENVGGINIDDSLTDTEGGFVRSRSTCFTAGALGRVVAANDTMGIADTVGLRVAWEERMNSKTFATIATGAHSVASIKS